MLDPVTGIRSGFHWHELRWWIAIAERFNSIEDKTTLVALVRVADPRRFSRYSSFSDQGAAYFSSAGSDNFVQSARCCHVVMYKWNDLPTYRYKRANPYVDGDSRSFLNQQYKSSWNYTATKLIQILEHTGSSFHSAQFYLVNQLEPL